MRRITDGLRDSQTGRISSTEIWSRVRSAFAVLLSVGVLAGGGIFVYQQANTAWREFQDSQQDDYEGAGVAPVEIEIPSGTALSEISDILAEKDVVKTAKAFDREVKANADSKKIQAGRYNLKTQMSAKLALAWLLDPKNVVREWMTLTEGQWLTTSIKQMAKATKLPEKDFEKVLKKWKDLGLPEWAEECEDREVEACAEGFIFPDSYELPTTPKAAGIVKTAVKQFKAKLKEIDFEDAVENLDVKKRLKITPYDALIVASIIDREVNKAEDRPRVARVIYNRLEQGYPIGMDSTIAYAVGKQGVLELTQKDLDTDSPYNTRKYKGLPPGPISNPGKAAMEAAVNPAEGDWLYYVTVDPSTGETKFTHSASEFEEFKQEYKDWCEATDANYKVCYGKDR